MPIRIDREIEVILRIGRGELACEGCFAALARTAEQGDRVVGKGSLNTLAIIRAINHNLKSCSRIA